MATNDSTLEEDMSGVECPIASFVRGLKTFETRHCRDEPIIIRFWLYEPIYGTDRKLFFYLDIDVIPWVGAVRVNLTGLTCRRSCNHGNL